MKTGTQVKREFYDKFCRDQRSKDFYRSAAWKQVKEMKLSRDPLCEACSQADRTVPSRMVHHIFKITTPTGWAHRLDLTFLLSLCLPCHNQVEAEMEREGNREGEGGGHLHGFHS